MVIQRWQSVLLLVAAAAMGCFTFLSLGQLQTAEYTLDFTSLGFAIEGEATEGAESGYMARTWFFFALSLLSAILPLVSIFLFGNLRRQTRLCLVSLLVVIAAACYGGMLGYTAFPGAELHWTSVALAPAVALCGILLAIRYIRKDARMLKAVDRIR